MKHRNASAVFAVVSALGLALAVRAQVPPRFDTIEIAVEAPATKVTLPSGADSALVMAPCGGCAPKSFPATRATTYFIGEQQVSLAELRSVVAARPDTFLTVRYVVRTGELANVTADIVAVATGGGR